MSHNALNALPVNRLERLVHENLRQAHPTGRNALPQLQFLRAAVAEGRSRIRRNNSATLAQLDEVIRANDPLPNALPDDGGNHASTVDGTGQAWSEGDEFANSSTLFDWVQSPALGLFTQLTSPDEGIRYQGFKEFDERADTVSPPTVVEVARLLSSDKRSHQLQGVLEACRALPDLAPFLTLFKPPGRAAATGQPRPASVSIPASAGEWVLAEPLSALTSTPPKEDTPVQTSSVTEDRMSQVKQTDSTTISIELPATTVSRLREKAQATGQPLEDYLTQFLTPLAGATYPMFSTNPQLTLDQFRAKLREMAVMGDGQSLPAEWSRADLYDDHD